MALPWFRTDVNIASHDKTLAVLDDLGRQNGRAVMFSYLCIIGYCVGNGTDGHIKFSALPFVHATKRDMEALVKAGLLDPDRSGWTVRNFAERQQTSAVTSAVAGDKRRASAKGNCVRHHGADCGCWKEKVA